LLRKAGLLISEAEGAEVFGDELEKPGLSEEFRTMLRYGRSVRAGVLARAYRLLQQIAVSFDHSVQGVEGLLIPTAPQRAFPHESNVPVNQADFTALANAAGAPAMTFPLTSSDGGLPCAAQIIGHKWSDHRLIAIGKMLEELPCVSAAI
jgi:aspartyl-tRNA(Asn)/glutamyl-tRNA(Gln) amidotransferase subunit A